MHSPATADAGLYGRSFAAVYDEWYDDPESASLTAAVLDDIAHGRDVLELGVGTGAIARRLTTAGPVVGLDSSPEMLERLQRAGGREVRPVLGDMTAVDEALAAADITTSFGLVFCSHNTFLNLTSIDAQRSCLRAVASSLEPGGSFLIENIVPVAIEGRHVEIAGSAVAVRPWRVLPIAPDSLDAMAGAAGLELVDAWRDWDRTPFDDDSVRIAHFRRR